MAIERSITGKIFVAGGTKLGHYQQLKLNRYGYIVPPGHDDYLSIRSLLTETLTECGELISDSCYNNIKDNIKSLHHGHDNSDLMKLQKLFETEGEKKSSVKKNNCLIQ